MLKQPQIYFIAKHNVPKVVYFVAVSLYSGLEVSRLLHGNVPLKVCVNDMLKEIKSE